MPATDVLRSGPYSTGDSTPERAPKKLHHQLVQDFRRKVQDNRYAYHALIIPAFNYLKPATVDVIFK